MPRTNSISDEADGRSLTPDLPEEELNVPRSPTRANAQAPLLSPTNLKTTRSKASLRSQAGSHRPPSHVFPVLSPGDRFRAVVRKVMAMHRTTTLLGESIGAEPGIDPRRDSAQQTYGHIRENCLIEVCDYSSVRSSFGRMTNREFVDYMNNDAASAKEPWVKVRWINISGISWDVMSAVAIKYGLHPLSLEDVLHTTAQKRSKIDYYTKHIFLRILCHSISRDGEFTLLSAPVYDSHPAIDFPRSASPEPFNDRDAKDIDKVAINGQSDPPMYDSTTLTPKRGPKARFMTDLEKASVRFPRFGFRHNAARDERLREEITLEELKKGDRVNVKVEPIFIFLTREDTVISLHTAKNHGITEPIATRLRQRHTSLRTSADPSMLVQSLLDLIVDQALEVCDAYHGKILKFERDILLRPNMKTVRNLHILSGDLILHKRTLEPIKTIIYGLRRYDIDRCAALIDQSKSSGDAKIVGYMSHKSKIYLADVSDHMEHILGNLDMFASIAENLINYFFNISSHDMNEVMRRLTLATIIFLPLTLLTGYFGMNFNPMWSVNHHSDRLFWIVALPIMFIIIPIFLWEDVRKMVHYVEKRIAARDAIKVYKQE